jgi:hypothetical protein
MIGGSAKSSSLSRETRFVFVDSPMSVFFHLLMPFEIASLWYSGIGLDRITIAHAREQQGYLPLCNTLHIGHAFCLYTLGIGKTSTRQDKH